jgi:hypothetical protein
MLTFILKASSYLAFRDIRLGSWTPEMSQRRDNEDAVRSITHFCPSRGWKTNYNHKVVLKNECYGIKEHVFLSHKSKVLQSFLVLFCC